MAAAFSKAENATTVTVAIGVSLAENTIDKTLDATIENANLLESNGTVTVATDDQSSIHSLAVAAGIAGSLATKGTGFTATGAGADSTNRITSFNNATIENSVIIAGGPVSITADSGTSGVESLTPNDTIANFTDKLDDAGTVDLNQEATPDPDDVTDDNSLKTELRTQF